MNSFNNKETTGPKYDPKSQIWTAYLVLLFTTGNDYNLLFFKFLFLSCCIPLEGKLSVESDKIDQNS